VNLANYLIPNYDPVRRSDSVVLNLQFLHLQRWVHRELVAHAQVVAGAPDHDVTRAARRMPDRTGKTPGDPLE
jgi:hypothetical protein